jgi:hypothetical protein
MPNERSLQEQTLRELSLQRAIAEQNSKMLRDLVGKIGIRQGGESRARPFEVLLSRKP